MGVFSTVLLKTAVRAAARTRPPPIKSQRCPLCLSLPGTTRQAFVKHVGRHMEKIALAFLPREFNSDSDVGSIETTSSLKSNEQRIEPQSPGSSNAAEVFLTKCFCHTSDGDENVVQCEDCKTWQHLDCYYEAESVPAVHKCTECSPRRLSRQPTNKQHEERSKTKASRSQARLQRYGSRAWDEQTTIAN